MEEVWRCAFCGELHQLAFAFHVPAPDSWAHLDEASRQAGHLDSDLCWFPGGHYFMRGLVIVPVEGGGEFHWGVWVSLSETRWQRLMASFEVPGREHEPPAFGWFDNGLDAVYSPTTRGLKTNLHTEPVGQRPLIELEPTDHPLAVEQRTGITLDRVSEINEILRHRSG